MPYQEADEVLITAPCKHTGQIAVVSNVFRNYLHVTTTDGCNYEFCQDDVEPIGHLPSDPWLNMLSVRPVLC